MAALKELIDAGKILNYGLSNETCFGVCEFGRVADELGCPRPVSIQNSFSLIHRSFETELAEACAPRNYNVGLLPWSPLAGGALSGAPSAPNASPEPQSLLCKMRVTIPSFTNSESSGPLATNGTREESGWMRAAGDVRHRIHHKKAACSTN